MPAYDFNCKDCGAAYEARLSMSAYSTGEGRTCPSCGSLKTERMFTAVSVITGGRSEGCSDSQRANCGNAGFT